MIIQCRASQARFEVQHLVVALTERFLTVLYNKFKIFERQLNLLALTIDKQFTIYYIEISSKRLGLGIPGQRVDPPPLF